MKNYLRITILIITDLMKGSLRKIASDERLQSLLRLTGDLDLTNGGHQWGQGRRCWSNTTVRPLRKKIKYHEKHGSLIKISRL